MSQALIDQRYHRGDAGFSLLEVVTALAILSMMLMAIYEISLGGMHRAEVAKRDMLSLALAQSIMDEKLAKEDWREGHEEGSEAGLKWSREISTYVADETLQRRERYQLFKIVVAVGEHTELQSLKRIEVAR